MDAYPPTAADYANSNAEGAQRTAEDALESNRSLEQKLREQNTLLQGQISFLARYLHDHIDGTVLRSGEDFAMLERIANLGKD